jgi:hypothetical protein
MLLHGNGKWRAVLIGSADIHIPSRDRGLLAGASCGSAGLHFTFFNVALRT